MLACPKNPSTYQLHQRRISKQHTSPIDLVPPLLDHWPWQLQKLCLQNNSRLLVSFVSFLLCWAHVLTGHASLQAPSPRRTRTNPPRTPRRSLITLRYETSSRIPPSTTGSFYLARINPTKMNPQEQAPTPRRMISTTTKRPLSTAPRPSPSLTRLTRTNSTP